MKTKVLYLMAAVFAVSLIAEIAMAGPWYVGCLGYGGFGIPNIPNLTPEQATKIQCIRENYLKDIIPLRQQLVAKKLELRSLWLSQNPDQAKINALQKEIPNLNAKIQEKSTNASLITQPEWLSQLNWVGGNSGRIHVLTASHKSLCLR